jgi:cellulose synthase operon protein C
MLDPLADTMAGDVDYWEVSAFAFLQAGEPEKAVEAFRQAGQIVVDPLGTRPSLHVRGGRSRGDARRRGAWRSRGRWPRISRAAERHPVANYLMARVELQSGNGDQALAYAQAILAVQPDSSVGHMMAGAASLSLGQASQAERHLERAIASDPGNIAGAQAAGADSARTAISGARARGARACAR